MRIASTDGVTVAVHDLGGDGEPFLICHATGFCAQAYTPMAARLAERHHVWGLDFRGHGDTPAPVRFLPTWDATLLVHARRTQILPERFRPMVFDTKTPHSVPTFLVDGQVAGTWRVEG